MLRSVQTKILIPVIISIIAIIAFLLTFSILSSVDKQNYVIDEFNTIIEEDVKDRLEAVAEAEAGEIKAEIEVALDSARTLAQVLSTNNEVNFTRNEVNTILKKILIENQSFLGTYTCWEPDAFDEMDDQYENTRGHDKTGRFIPYWNKDTNNNIALEPLVGYEDDTKDENGIRAGEYYLLPRETKNEVITDPYSYVVQGESILLTSLVVPVLIDEKFKGIAGVDISLNFLQDLVNTKNKNLYDGAGSIYILSNIGLISAYSGNTELIGKTVEAIELDIDHLDEHHEELMENIKNGEAMVEFDRESNLITVQTPIEIGYTNMPWSVVIDVPLDVVLSEVESFNDSLDNRLRNDTIIQILIGIGILIVVAIVILIIVRRIIKPIKKANEIVEKTSDGILVQERVDIKSKDEIGNLIRSMNKLIDFLNDRNIAMSQIADGNLTIDVKLASEEDEVGKSMVNMVETLNSIVEQIDLAIDQVNSGAKQISESTQSLSEGASNQASSLEEVSASISEITSQVQSNTEGSVKVNQLADDTLKNATEGNNRMKELVNAMDEINKSAEDIKNIVKTIDDIAFQTNLLALNADIEAARVGKYGRGFAVVANSVRNLAGKSAESVKETTKNVESAIRNIKNGVSLVNITSEKLDEITKSANEVTSISTEVSESSQEQAKGIEQISTALNQVEEIVQTNSANSEENAASSEELLAQVKKLKDLISYFTTQNDEKTLSTESKEVIPYSEES